MRFSIVYWMLLFLGVVTLVGALLFPDLQRAFTANPVFNGLILSVLLIGIAVNFRQVLALRPESRWLLQRQDRDDGPPVSPKLLAPLDRMLAMREGKIRLSALSSRSVLDGLRLRLDEHREVSRYLVGLLIFLGLLGTFWGLLDTINAVGGVIGGLDLGHGGLEEVFHKLKMNLQSPLAGMGTAFSSSLFGLGGSLILGFFDLQAGHAENHFLKKVEDWLAEVTHLSAGPAFEGETPVPVYIEALLEKTADNLESMTRVLRRSEEERGGLREQLVQLNSRLAEVGDMVHAEQSASRTLARHQAELQPLLARMADGLEEGGRDQEAFRADVRSLAATLQSFIEGQSQTQEQALSDLRQELRLMTRTLAGRSSTGEG